MVGAFVLSLQLNSQPAPQPKPIQVPVVQYQPVAPSAPIVPTVPSYNPSGFGTPEPVQVVQPPQIIVQTYAEFQNALRQGSNSGARNAAAKMINLVAMNPRYRDWLKANNPNELYTLLHLRDQIPPEPVYVEQYQTQVIPVFPYGCDYRNYSYAGYGYANYWTVGRPLYYPRVCNSYGIPRCGQIYRSACPPIRSACISRASYVSRSIPYRASAPIMRAGGVRSPVVRSAAVRSAPVRRR